MDSTLLSFCSPLLPPRSLLCAQFPASFVPLCHRETTKRARGRSQKTKRKKNCRVRVSSHMDKYYPSVEQRAFRTVTCVADALSPDSGATGGISKCGPCSVLAASPTQTFCQAVKSNVASSRCALLTWVSFSCITHRDTCLVHFESSTWTCT